MTIMNMLLETIKKEALEELKKCPMSGGISAKDAPNYSKLLAMHGSGEIGTDQWQEFCHKVSKRFE